MGVQMGLGLSVPKLEYLRWYNKYSLSFDGANDYMVMDEAAELVDKDNGTVSLWTKLDSTSSNGIMFKASVDSDNFIAITYNNSAQEIQMTYRAAGTSKVANGAFAHEASNAWHHVAVTWNTDEDFVKGYVDGTRIETVTSLTTFAGTINKVYAARNTLSANSYHAGHLDSIAIFSNTKSDAEIVTLYNNGKPNDLALYSGLVGYWRMDEGSGTTVEDLSSNNNTSDLIHAPAWTTDVP